MEKKRGNPNWVRGRFHPTQGGGSKAKPGDRRHYRTKSSMEDFLKALKHVERTERVNIFVRFIKRALENDTVMVHLIKKILPDLNSVNLDIEDKGLPEEVVKRIREELAKRFE